MRIPFANNKKRDNISSTFVIPAGNLRFARGAYNLNMSFTVQPADALLVIDMQNDFLPGGSLAVAEGDLIVPGINALAAKFEHVVLTQDWHPLGHISFASTHGLRPFVDTVQVAYGTQHLWPDHCVQGTRGAELHPGLAIPHAELLLRKGFRREIDSYSAFTENDGVTPTGLAGYLRERGLTRLFFVGVAYDFCVGFSALAAVRLGFEAIVVEDLSRAVGLPGTVDTTNGAFAAEGVGRISSAEMPTL
jgi:nicotinamidase/pyrazinamidase